MSPAPSTCGVQADIGGLVERVALLEHALHETRQRADSLLWALQELAPYLAKQAYGRDEWTAEFDRVPSPPWQDTEALKAWLDDRHHRLGDFFLGMNLQQLYSLAPCVTDSLEPVYPEGIPPEHPDTEECVPFPDAYLWGARRRFAGRAEVEAEMSALGAVDAIERAAAKAAEDVAA